jgi:hypothetical protein
VKYLVEKGMTVYEIAPVEQTLEDFYLGLMNDSKKRSVGDDAGASNKYAQ